MKIGNRATLAELDAKGWIAFAADAGLGLPLIRRRIAEISEATIARAPEVAQALAGHGLDDEGLSDLASIIAGRAERCAITFRNAPE